MATFVVDHAVKAVVERTLDEGERGSGPLGLDVQRITHRDALGGSGSVAMLAAGAALAVGIGGAGVLVRRPALAQIGAGMVAGAMLANVADRVLGGGVTDFLPTPLGVINVADAAIGAGIALAGLGLLLR